MNKFQNKYFLAILIILLFAISYRIITKNQSEIENKVAVQINVKNNEQKEMLRKYLNNDIDFDKISYIEAAVSWKQFFQLQNKGFEPTLKIEIERNKIIDNHFHTFSEISKLIEFYNKKYSKIVYIEKIGEGMEKHLPIWGIKISDNPHLDENEPAVLLTGIHHAKELLGAEVCLYLLKYLCQNYDTNAKVRQWINDTEIWIVPVLNPDGYYMVMDEEISPQFWRKNIRDNDNNGVFDPEKDGVDLNRNYDYNWASEDSDNDPRSWYYRGAFPFSENETKAIRDLTLREKFVFHLDYHSYGEIIIYPWENYIPPPDRNLIIELAEELAGRIKKRSKFGNYSIRPLNGKLGQSSVWMHGKAGVQSFIVEVGDSHFPEGKYISTIVEENANSAYFVLERLTKSAIKGVIRNAYNKTPLSAEIEIEKYASPIITNPVSDARSGYYFRIVQPGMYTIKFSAPGFRTKNIRSVKVESDKLTTLNVELHPIENVFPTEN